MTPHYTAETHKRASERFAYTFDGLLMSYTTRSFLEPRPHRADPAPKQVSQVHWRLQRLQGVAGQLLPRREGAAAPEQPRQGQGVGQQVRGKDEGGGQGPLRAHVEMCRPKQRPNRPTATAAGSPLSRRGSLERGAAHRPAPSRRPTASRRAAPRGQEPPLPQQPASRTQSSMRDAP